VALTRHWRIAVAIGTAAAILAIALSTDWILEAWYLRKLESPDLVTSYAAAWKLGGLRSARAVPRIVELFRACEGHDDAAAAAAGEMGLTAGCFFGLILWKIGPPAVPALREVARDANPDCRIWATWALRLLEAEARS